MVNLLVVFAQFVLAGLLIGGKAPEARLLHGVTGLLLLLVALTQLALVIFMRRKMRTPGWLVTASLGIVVAEIIECVCGHFGVVALHVPLALGIAVGISRQLFWVIEALDTEAEARS